MVFCDLVVDLSEIWVFGCFNMPLASVLFEYNRYDLFLIFNFSNILFTVISMPQPVNQTSMIDSCHVKLVTSPRAGAFLAITLDNWVFPGEVGDTPHKPNSGGLCLCAAKTGG